MKVRRTDGLWKRRDVSAARLGNVDHPWYFTFKWKTTHHRFPIDSEAGRPITDRDLARTEADRLRILIRSDQARSKNW
jgi:hypothetical protein